MLEDWYYDYYLTPKEQVIRDLLLQGKNYKQIMERLSIKRSTLNSHLNCLFSKLQINSRADLLILKIRALEDKIDELTKEKWNN